MRLLYILWPILCSVSLTLIVDTTKETASNATLHGNAKDANASASIPNANASIRNTNASIPNTVASPGSNSTLQPGSDDNLSSTSTASSSTISSSTLSYSSSSTSTSSTASFSSTKTSSRSHSPKPSSPLPQELVKTPDPNPAPITPPPVDRGIQKIVFGNPAPITPPPPVDRGIQKLVIGNPDPAPVTPPLPIDRGIQKLDISNPFTPLVKKIQNEQQAKAKQRMEQQNPATSTSLSLAALAKSVDVASISSSTDAVTATTTDSTSSTPPSSSTASSSISTGFPESLETSKPSPNVSLSNTAASPPFAAPASLWVPILSIFIAVVFIWLCVYIWKNRGYIQQAWSYSNSKHASTTSEYSIKPDLEAANFNRKKRRQSSIFGEESLLLSDKSDTTPPPRLARTRALLSQLLYLPLLPAVTIQDEVERVVEKAKTRAASDQSHLKTLTFAPTSSCRPSSVTDSEYSEFSQDATSCISSKIPPAAAVHHQGEKDRSYNSFLDHCRDRIGHAGRVSVISTSSSFEEYNQVSMDGSFDFSL